MKPGIFILSPHIDDAAFSLALTISQLVACGLPVTIINCFTISRFTAVVGPKDRETVTWLRKSEDQAFNELLNLQLRLINLDLYDAPLRNNYIWSSQPFDPAEISLVHRVSSELNRIVDGLLFCPLGIGDHIDHLICKEAVLQMDPPVRALFYEDLPYASRITNEQKDFYIRLLEGRLNRTLSSRIEGSQSIGVDKEKAIHLYKTQMNDEISSEIISYLRAVGGERVWGDQETLAVLTDCRLPYLFDGRNST